MKWWMPFGGGLAVLAGLASSVSAQADSPRTAAHAARIAAESVDNDGAARPGSPASPGPARSTPNAEQLVTRIKEDEASSRARRAAVRYLATVDFHYWPEARESLIQALRGDRNEQVRLEAAQALHNSKFCTNATVKALTVVVAGSEEDGYPRETSERVKTAAEAALRRCLTARGEAVSSGPTAAAKARKPDERLATAQDPAEFYRQIEQQSKEQIVANARGVLGKGWKRPTAETSVREPGVYDWLASALRGRGTEKAPANPEPTPRYTAIAPKSSPPPAPSRPTMLPPPKPPEPLAQAKPASLPAGSPELEMAQAMSVLRASVVPEQREWAVYKLAYYDLPANPPALQAILDAARDDQEPAVRIACLRCLALLNCKSLPILATVQALQSDPDLRVRQEADQAMGLLCAVPPPGSPPSGMSGN